MTDFKQDRPLVPKHPMDFGAAGGLSDFGDNYTWFTPSFLYLFGRFTDGHLQCFMEEVKREVQILLYTFSRPLFAGLEDRNRHPGWNHTLWAVEAADYPALEQYLLTVAVYDNARHRVYRVGVQKLRIVDPLWHDLNAIVTPRSPRIEISSFGVDSNVGQVGFDSSTDPPSARRFPPRDTTKVFSEMVLGGEVPVPVLDAEMEAIAPLPPLPDTPVHLDIRSIQDMSPEKQAEVAELIRQYRQRSKEFRT